MDYSQKAENANFYSDPDYEFVIKTKRKYREDYGRYSMVGLLRHKNTRKVYMDLLDLLGTVSKSAYHVFTEIRHKRNDTTNISVMSEWKDLDANNRRENNRRLAELREADLVLKVRPVKGILMVNEPYSYMINPHLIKPWQYNEAKILWKKLKQTINK